VGARLVERHDHLLHAQREGEQRVLAGLAVLGDASLEAAGRRVDHQHGAVGLKGAKHAQRPPRAATEAKSATTRRAWLVPVIMFLMKSRWPGASMTVQ
jgi:hypothetical protein